MSQMANIRLEVITAQSFDDLKSLVREQAAHHKCDYVGDDNVFVREMCRDNPVAKTIIARDPETNVPMGYILYHLNHTLKGRELYIEDILVSGRQRSNGLGHEMMESLKEIAREQGIDNISWCVSRNNKSAVRFYENRVQAEKLSCDIHDGSVLLSAPTQAFDDYEVRRADAGDIDLVASYAERIKKLSEEKVQHIRDAAHAAHAEVYIVLDREGTPKALGVTNASFSTFRTVYGAKFELMELQVSDTKDACRAFEALTAHVVDEARNKENLGHLNIIRDRESIAQKVFVEKLALPVLQMSDDPASAFDVYGIGRDIVRKPANVIKLSPPPRPPQGPDMEAFGG